MKHCYYNVQNFSFKVAYVFTVSIAFHIILIIMDFYNEWVLYEYKYFKDHVIKNYIHH